MKKVTKLYKNVIFYEFFLFFFFVSWTEFPQEETWFSDVYSHMSFVNICLKYTCITFRQILLDKIILFLDPMNIPWIRFKTVVLYGAKQTDDVLAYEKQTILVFLIREITVVFVIKNQLFFKLWMFQLFCIPFVSESAFKQFSNE